MIFQKVVKQEKLYMLSAIAFAFIYFAFGMPWIMRTFDDSNPILSFALFNIGLVLFLQLFLKSMITKKHISLQTILGLALVFVATDTWSPPYALQVNGSVIPGNTIPLLGASSDGIGGMIGTNIFHIHGLVPLLNGVGWNFLWTYIAFPSLLLLLASLLLKDFVKQL